jgi:1,4-dihydroxy-2-naphthoate octaprenyltransferase
MTSRENIKIVITSWFIIVRAPLLTVIIVPILVGASWVAYQNLVQPFPWDSFSLAFFVGVFLHIAAHTFNCYSDWKSGTDQTNNDYFLSYYDTRRIFNLGLISEKAVFRVSLISLITASVLGLILAFRSGPGIFLFGVIGALSFYFYMAPPLRLLGRKGFGVLLIGIIFGPFAIAGTVYALSENVSISNFLIGIPVGLLATAIPWINQFPGGNSDRVAGRINLGAKFTHRGYLLLLATAYALLLYYFFVEGVVPVGAMLPFASIPLAVYAGRIAVRDYDQRSMIRANAATIRLHLVYGLLLAAGLYLSAPISEFIWNSVCC